MVKLLLLGSVLLFGNEESNKLYPFEVDNAPQFWTGVRLKKNQP